MRAKSCPSQYWNSSLEWMLVTSMVSQPVSLLLSYSLLLRFEPYLSSSETRRTVDCVLQGVKGLPCHGSGSVCVDSLPSAVEFGCTWETAAGFTTCSGERSSADDRYSRQIHGPGKYNETQPGCFHIVGDEQLLLRRFLWYHILPNLNLAQRTGLVYVTKPDELLRDRYGSC